MKFHHMTICSPNGLPPRTRTRVGSDGLAPSVIAEAPAGWNTISPGWAVAPPTARRPVSHRNPCSWAASTSRSSERPGARVTSAPTSAEYAGTGEVCPNRPPRNTRACAPPTSDRRLVVPEPGFCEPVRRGQGDPQLRAVKHGRRGRGVLRVGDAGAGRHEVQLPGADERVGAGRVAVFDLAGEQP